MEKRRNCSLGAISPLFHNIFFYLLLDFHVYAGTKFSLRDKRLFEIARVNCICIFMMSMYISFTMSMQILQNLSESINYFRQRLAPDSIFK